MKLNPQDRYIQYVVLLDNMDEDSLKRLVADAEEHYGSPWELTIKDFFAAVDGDYSCIDLPKTELLNATIRQYAWVRSFKECSEQVSAILKKLQVPMTDKAKRASEHCMKMNFKESTLIFCRKYFGLRSFAEAENTTLADFIVAKKDTFNNGMFQYAMNEIQRIDMKKK